MGASNHSKEDREINDYYATDPIAAQLLMQNEKLDKHIWECACGGGNLSKEFEKSGHIVKSTDLIYRGYGVGGVDFLKQTEKFDGDIVTNPPYSLVFEFVKHANNLLMKDGNKVCMFLRILFLEGQRRKSYLRNIH